MDMTTMMLGMVFGSIGLGMFIYGKREQRLAPVVAGCVLMACPYFVPGVWVLLLVGVLLTASPFVIRV